MKTNYRIRGTKAYRALLTSLAMLAAWSYAVKADPLDNWHQRFSSTFIVMRSVTQGTTNIVAVSNRLLSSSDGTTWTFRSFPNFGNGILYSIAYGNGLYAAVGVDIITSSDGVQWTTRQPTFISPLLAAVTYGSAGFVAVGDSGTLWTSADGATWVHRSSGTTSGRSGVAYGNGLYVEVGTSGLVRTSPDGTNWTTRSSGIATDLRGVTYANGLFVAVGSSGAILTSTDGTSWTAGSSGASADLYASAYGQGTWVVVGNLGAILTATNAATWQPRNSGTTNLLLGVAYDGSTASGTFVAVGSLTILQSDVLAGPPSINAQPSSQTALASGQVQFAVSAVGASPLNYQWQLNSTNLPDATNATLTFSNVTPAVSGPYDVVVSNSLGTVTSSIAVLSVMPAFAVTLPANRVSVGNATLNGALQAAASDTVAWFEWGTNANYGNLTGATNLPASASVGFMSYALSGLSLGQVYHYHLVVSNVFGTVAGADQQFASSSTVVMSPSSYVSAPPAGLGAVVATSGGGNNAAVLKDDGTVAVWGDNTYGQTNLPAGLSNVVAIAAGQYHMLALGSDGTVVAWGANTYGQSTVPATLSNVVAVAAGTTHSLALKADGTAVAWGNNSSGQATVPAGLTSAVAISAGDFHSIALRADGTVAVWGGNGQGQANIPAGLGNVVGITAGWYHNLVLKNDGTVVAWGNNSFGQTNVPIGLTNVVGLGAGFQNSLALRSDGTMVGWGNAGLPSGATNVVAIAGGYDFSLALVPLAAPTASTLAVCCVDSSSATLYGLVNPNGSPTTAYFRWGTTTNYENITTPSAVGSGSSPTNIASPISGLLAGALYHYRAEASNIVGVATGVDMTFATPDVPRTITSFALLPPGQFQLGFTGGPNASYTILASPDVTLPTTNWTVLGPAQRLGGGAYQFTDPDATNYPQRFYQLRSP